MGERSLRDLFHLIKKVLPDDQIPFTITGDIPVRDALQAMQEKNFSQVPVVAGNEVLGVFSHRSFAYGLLRLPKDHGDALNLSVEEFLEEINFAQITDDLAGLIDEFEIKDAVLVGFHDRVQGIVTTIDALKYFYRVASPYVMLFEIELAIRELMRHSLDENELRDCIKCTLQKHYEKSGMKIPSSLEDMTFNDYVTLICFKDTWEKFSPMFGSQRNIVHTKLKDIPELRNVVFHFKREVTVAEYDLLRDVRDWLLKRVRKFEGIRKSTSND
jgi:hypothetical protein